MQYGVRMERGANVQKNVVPEPKRDRDPASMTTHAVPRAVVKPPRPGLVQSMKSWMRYGVHGVPSVDAHEAVEVEPNNDQENVQLATNVEKPAREPPPKQKNATHKHVQ